MRKYGRNWRRNQETHKYYKEKLKYLIGVDIGGTGLCGPRLICLVKTFRANCSTLWEIGLDVPKEVNDTCEFKVESFGEWKKTHPDPPPELPATYGRMWKIWMGGISGVLELGRKNIIGCRSGQVGSIKKERDGVRVLLMVILLAVGIGGEEFFLPQT